jgi:hypothetical protein
MTEGMAALDHASSFRFSAAGDACALSTVGEDKSRMSMSMPVPVPVPELCCRHRHWLQTQDVTELMPI